MNSFKRVRTFQIELEFGSVFFLGEGKTEVPGEKPLGAKERTNNKLNPHMASTTGFEPRPHWWETSALTTAPPLPSQTWYITYRSNSGSWVQHCLSNFTTRGTDFIGCFPSFSSSSSSSSSSDWKNLTPACWRKGRNSSAVCYVKLRVVKLFIP